MLSCFIFPNRNTVLKGIYHHYHLPREIHRIHSASVLNAEKIGNSEWYSPVHHRHISMASPAPGWRGGNIWLLLLDDISSSPNAGILPAQDSEVAAKQPQSCSQMDRQTTAAHPPPSWGRFPSQPFLSLFLLPKKIPGIEEQLAGDREHLLPKGSEDKANYFLQ